MPSHQNYYRSFTNVNYIKSPFLHACATFLIYACAQTTDAHAFFAAIFIMSGRGILSKKRKLDSMDSDEDVDEMESPESKQIEPIKIGSDGDEADEEADDENDDVESKEVADKLQVQQGMDIQEHMPNVLTNILM